MTNVAKLPYASGPGWQAIELPYGDRQVAMDVILPAAGRDADFEASLSASTFGAMVAALQPTSAKVSLPKFHVGGSTTSLKGALQALGMESAFGAGANFEAIAQHIFVSDVLHQAYVDVDELGTEAPSGSGGSRATGGAAAAAAVHLSVDRPFFVAVRDVPTGSILFAGKIVDPAAQE
jgi:serine protease inhibitor